MAEQIECEARKLDIHDPAEPVFDLLKAYLERRRDELIASLGARLAPRTPWAMRLNSASAFALL